MKHKKSFKNSAILEREKTKMRREKKRVPCMEVEDGSKMSEIQGRRKVKENASFFFFLKDYK